MKEYCSIQPIIPDTTTYLVLLIGCADLVSPTKGKTLIKEIQEKQLDSSEMIKSAMLTFYSKTCNQKKTTEILTDILSSNPSIMSYNCILASYARHGQGKKALNLFKSMVKNSVQPNGDTITIILNALSHSGMVEEAIKIYSTIETLKIIPSPSHKTVMVDVFARAGLFNEAEQLIGDSTEAILWRTLMAGCRKHNNIEIAEKIFEILTKIEPTDPSPYILLSNIYMFKGNNTKASEIRGLMVQQGIKKIPGIVYSEDKGTTYQFISGSSNYPLFTEVENKRKEIYQKIIGAGYVSDTRWVTNAQLISEEEKIDSLCRHAEKIAISHAFVLQPNRKKILLTSNLRVCNDCHNAIAYISKEMNVEIVVRDANRYHHFKNGKCSCNDYW
ncbi:predicted protein [Naegleria gruberi]|uniref:Predicted protein n=1 Tax=Naegleria gruberi TaxID=5762 RepID=D2VCA6_NAEGR|nr:uncharacterized protein NAEGRDRAFT_66503 [Naegleria gruberi]EFC45621.1 predicted protein [Naegleria gruberi]|eukprot:XP_002678365.1 predicted protein [Naegleria gruberi strain NEG-M]